MPAAARLAAPALDLLLISADPVLHRAHGRALLEAGCNLARALDVPAALAPNCALVIFDLEGGAVPPALFEHGRPLLFLLPAGQAAPDWLVLAGPLVDCLAKPCSSAELLARIRGLLRQMQSTADAVAPVYHFAGFTLDTRRQLLCRADGAVLPLTPAEYALLLTMLRFPGQVLDRPLLLRCLAVARQGERVREDDAGRRIDAAVRRLRAKLEPQPRQPRLIRTCHGRGYRLDASVRQG